MGALMRKSTKKELVNKLLDAMFSNVRHPCPVEREVFLICLMSVFSLCCRECSCLSNFLC